MNAKALICNADQHFALCDVTLPEPAPNNVVIRTLRSGVSVGTEFALVRNKISWGPYPLCTGYQGVGVIEHAGADVEGFAVGDRVYYRDNQGMTLADGTSVSCVCGTHATHAVLDPATTHGLAQLPEGVDVDSAALFVMPAVGLFGVDMANPRMGDVVVVYGVGPIGLGVVAACAHRGCHVIAIDLDDHRLAVARKLGADDVANAKSDYAAVVHAVAPEGADVVFESTGIPSLIDTAIPLCRTLGKFVWQGNYGAEPVSMQFLPPHGRKLQMFFPCDDGLAPCRRAVIKNMISGALRWDHTISHHIDAGDSPEFFDSTNKGLTENLMCAVVHWSE